jgi:hypothetical protein
MTATPRAAARTMLADLHAAARTRGASPAGNSPAAQIALAAGALSDAYDGGRVDPARPGLGPAPDIAAAHLQVAVALLPGSDPLTRDLARASDRLYRESGAIVLDGHRSTAVTRQLVALAVAGGLRPYVDPRGLRNGLYRVQLDSGGRRDCLFGCLDVSERKGRAVRAYLMHGRLGDERRYESVAEIRQVLASWVALRRGYDGG